MVKRLVGSGLAVGLFWGLACSWTPDDGPVNIPLDQANATITVRQSAGSSQATATAVITDDRGRPVELDAGQEVAVNGQALLGPQSNDEYRRTVPVADEYVVRVTEPTRGVDETTLTSSGTFSITAPAAGSSPSLQGFVLTWSNADANLEVEVAIRQTILGDTHAADFGPLADSGSLTLTTTDLSDFQQGADMVITVTKRGSVNAINGFNSGTGSVEIAQSVTVVPGP